MKGHVFIISAATLVALVVLLAGMQTGGHIPERNRPDLKQPGERAAAIARESQQITDKDTRPHQRLTTHPQTLAHYHTHHHQKKERLPKEIQTYIDEQRIPQSRLIVETGPRGQLQFDPRGQFNTVTVATLNEDGELSISEHRIEPIPAQPEAPKAINKLEKQP